jgi:HEPN domain-containing protein
MTELPPEWPATEPTPAQSWLGRAEADLYVARLVLGDEGAALWIAAFHSQQAAEKAIKAGLIAQGVQPPKSHNLQELIALVDTESPLDPADAELLNPWAVEGRYAADTPDVSRGELQALLAAAERFVEAMRPIVDTSVPEPEPLDDDVNGTTEGR